MLENQNIEYKEIWKDEYFKQVCAFANTNGGKIIVGINDLGIPVGVDNLKNLLETIPNKSVQFLGLTIDVNSDIKNKKQILVIEVNKSSTPISYKGRYYYRSGSTVQELKAQELYNFILKKTGKTFDEIIIDNAGYSDINNTVLDKFIQKALITNRISQDSLKSNLEDRLINLNLVTNNTKLKNAAILLFGKNPLKFFSSVSFRIGKFNNTDYELLFQDIIEGDIFSMPDKIMDILKSKYLKHNITYEGLQRIEQLEYPEVALREAILNAIVHKDYTGAHIQLSVYDDKLVLWNQGKLPEGLSLDMLKEKHPSKPRNIAIADIFFKAGYIETWGRGMSKIFDSCKKQNLPVPVIEEIANGFQIIFYKSREKSREKSRDKSREKTSDLILLLIKEDKHITQKIMAEKLDLSVKAIEKNISKLKTNGILIRKGGKKIGYWEINKK